MKRPTITADDRELARLLLEGIRSEFAADKRAIEDVARCLSALHDRAVACASVRVEREFQIEPRKKGKP